MANYQSIDELLDSLDTGPLAPVPEDSSSRGFDPDVSSFFRGCTPETGVSSQHQPPNQQQPQFTAVYPMGHQFQGQPVAPPPQQQQQTPMPTGIRMITGLNGQQFYAAPMPSFDAQQQPHHQHHVQSMQQQQQPAGAQQYFYPYPNQMVHHPQFNQQQQQQQVQQQQQHPPSSSTPSNIMQHTHSAPHTPSPMPSSASNASNNQQQQQQQQQQQMPSIQINYQGQQMPPSFNYMHHPAYLQQSPNLSGPGILQPPPPPGPPAPLSTSQQQQPAHASNQQMSNNPNANPNPSPLQHHQPPPYHAYQMQQQNPYGKKRIVFFL